MNASDTVNPEPLNQQPPEVGGVAAYRAWRWLRIPFNERKSKTKPGDALIDRPIVQQRSGEFIDSDEAVFEELMSLLLFGHDTASGTIAWAFNHVHQDPASLQ